MKEYRNVTGRVELRDAEEGETMQTISGYAATFNSPTDMGYYVEQIDPAAFNNADLSDVVSCFNHQLESLLSRNTGNEGDLVLSIDEVGLRYEFKAKNDCAQECAKNIKLGFVKGSSFVFVADSESTEYDQVQPDGRSMDVRTILGIRKVYELGPVVFPAYEDTTAESIERSKEFRAKFEAARPKKVIEPTGKELRESYLIEFKKNKIK